MTVVCSLNSLVRLLPRDIIINYVTGLLCGKEAGWDGRGGGGGGQCPTCPVFPELECSFLSFKLHIQKTKQKNVYLQLYLWMILTA